MPRISQLPAKTVPASGDEIAIVEVATSTTKKITRADLLKGAPLPDNSVTTPAITNSSVTADKLGDSGWVNATLEAGFSGSLYYRRIGSFVNVVMTGVSTTSSTTTQTAFNLPAGYRPVNEIRFPQLPNSLSGSNMTKTAWVNNGGQIRGSWPLTSGSSNDYISTSFMFIAG